MVALSHSFLKRIGSWTPYFLYPKEVCKETKIALSRFSTFRNVCNQGHFWEKDQRGYLLNDAALYKVQSEFQKVLKTTNEIYFNLLGKENIHSCYITGSIARGKARIGQSDVNGIAILNNTTSQIGFRSLNEESKQKIEIPEITKFRLEVWVENDVFESDKEVLTRCQEILKLNSVCIYGDDLIPSIAPIEPDIVLVNTEIMHFITDLTEAFKGVFDRNENVELWTQKIITNLIRTAFCMIIPMEREFTRDLDLCAKTFLKYYPYLESEIDRCFELIKSPFSDRASLEQYFSEEFGALFLEEIEKWLDCYNPQRSLYLKRGFKRF